MSSVSREATLAGVGTLHLSVESAELADDDSYVIHGIALGAGDITVGQSGTKKLWPGEELKRAAETLEGTDLVRDHINSTKGKIGTVTHAEYLEDVGVIYEAEIASHYDEIAQDIEAGLMEVSVRAYHAPEPELEEDEETGALEVEDVLFDNLSVVNDGAAPSNTADTGAVDDFKDEYGDIEASVTVPQSGPTAVLSRSKAVLEADEQIADRDELAMDTDADPTSGEVFAPDEASLFDTKEDAEKRGEELGCGREAHEIELDGETKYVPCAEESVFKKHAVENADREEMMSLIEEGMKFFSTVNDSMLEIDSIEGDRAQVMSADGEATWKEDIDNIIQKIADDEWKHASGEEEMDDDSDRTHFAALDPRDHSDETECSECLSEETVAELADIPGTFSAEGTVYAIAPDEHDDESTKHPENAKYPMTSCDGEDSVDSAWHLREHGDYSIDQSTLEKRIIEAAKAMGCDPDVVDKDSWESDSEENSDSDSEGDTDSELEEGEVYTEMAECPVCGETSCEHMADDGTLNDDKVPAEFDTPCWDGYKMAGMKVKDGEQVPNCIPAESNASGDCGCETSRIVSVATTDHLSERDDHFGDTTSYKSTMIDKSNVSLDELSEDDVEGKVIVDEDELQDLAEKADRAESVEAELSELSEKLDEQDEASEVVDELADEEIDLIESEDDHEVVEAGKADLVDEVTDIYADELAEHYPGMDAEELADKFDPLELQGKVEDHAEAELSTSIQETEPEPEAGTASDEELEDQQEGDSDELSEEERREQYAEYLSNQGWDSQAEKVRNGELEISEAAE